LAKGAETPLITRQSKKTNQLLDANITAKHLRNMTSCLADIALRDITATHFADAQRKTTRPLEPKAQGALSRGKLRHCSAILSV